MTNTKTYWKSTEELEANSSFVEEQEKEFVEKLPETEFLADSSLEESSTNRRDFLKYLGFSVGAATLAACESPVKKAIPYLNKPEELTPGNASWYASTYWDGADYCPVLVKAREGRPIFVEGNKMSPITKGAINARVQASVLSLYDSSRLNGPLKAGSEASWSEVDKEISNKLNEIRENGGNVRIVTSSLISPSTKKAIDDFCVSFPISDSEEGSSTGASHIVYDAVSYSGIREANERSFGRKVVPSYHFDKAQSIVSVGADFLSSWVSPIEFSRQYGEARKLDGGKMAKHIQFESNLSLTGSNADNRIAIKPSMYGAVLANLYNEVARVFGAETISSPDVSGEIAASIKAAANSLIEYKSKSLLVVGSNNSAHQILANGINTMIGSYGNTIDLENSMLSIQSDDASVDQLLEEMHAGDVGALIVYGSNPSYTLPNPSSFNEALSKVGISISMADRLDETAALVNFVCPDSHYLESWGDALPINGSYSFQQPVIRPLYNTRQGQESLLAWAGIEMSYKDFIQTNLKENHFAEKSMFDSFWNQCIHDGVAQGSVNPESLTEVMPGSQMNSEALSGAANQIAAELAGGEWELSLYEKVGIGTGLHANNPWLQELPDPVSKVCWDNYITMNPDQMKELGFNTVLGQVQEADVVELTANGVTINAPVYPQYGQGRGTLGIALGYGRTGAGKTGNGVGVNAFPLSSFGENGLSYTCSDVQISGSVGKYHLATTQTHHTMMGRAPVRETTLEEYIKDPKSNNPDVLIASSDHKKMAPKDLNLWQSFPREGHFWNLSVDLSACIGCGACVVGCTSENNVPVVGKDEVRRSREMHWLRIDRYYSSDGQEGDYDAMEVPSTENNLEVVFQPIMCQHCNHAPCETVCPVAATTHSTDGLNQMIYNRCVGTKFCLNNCPYKVRRFNWFSYNNNDKFADVNPAYNDWERMVLNPDVTVRARGVMEKCSMCVQRIQDGKLTAKKSKQKLKDGEIQTACATACPTNAITFGDVNDENSKVAELNNDPRRYYLLEELNTQPSVHYLTKVRNKTKA